MQVSEREFRFCYMDELCKRIEQKMCPPRIIYFAECEDSTNRLFSCKVKLEGVTLMAKTDSEVFFNILASIECNCCVLLQLQKSPYQTVVMPWFGLLNYCIDE